jgi:microcompartment protein CcmK/EutM
LFLAKVKKAVTATQKHPAYSGKKIFVVQPVKPNGEETGDEWLAADCTGAGCGNLVICGGAPGVAGKIFGLKRAPIRTLILGIVDHLDYRDIS